MKEIVLITGAHGLVASKLSKLLESAYTVRFLTRHKQSENEFEWDIDQHYIDANALYDVDHVIHLAGANIAGKRWTSSRKSEIISSRIDGATLVLNSFKKNKIQLKSYISASAIGYYGTTTSETIYTEEAPKGNDFLSDVVEQWEQSADKFIESGVAKRVVKIRSGVILSQTTGALPKMMKPIQYFIGSSIGSGKQYIPWIHIDDISNIYKFLLENEKEDGVFNAVAPFPNTNKEITREIAKVLKRPLFFPPIPSFIIKLLFGEAASVILEGSRVSSKKIENSGFQFQYPNIKLALENLLRIY